MTNQPPKDVFNFPCVFPLKVIVRAGIDVEAEMLHWLETIVGPLESIRTRSSAGGKYLAITATFVAKDRAQLERIYGELKQRPDVVFSL